MLFDSLVKSNPKHAPGWIAAACLEEHAGRMVAARKIIKQGCEQCPKSEDIWLEAARLHVSFSWFVVSLKTSAYGFFFQNNEDAKIVLANAVQHVGQSVKIWLAAADLEYDVKAKKRVLRKGKSIIHIRPHCWRIDSIFVLSSRAYPKLRSPVERNRQPRIVCLGCTHPPRTRCRSHPAIG